MFRRWNNKRRLRRIAHDKMSYASLRPGQEKAIQALLDGHDTLVVMPTGSGKSFIYQASSLLMTGPTIIISPLIALQRDQVETIEEQHILDSRAIRTLGAAADGAEGTSAFKERRPVKFPDTLSKNSPSWIPWVCILLLFALGEND